MADAPPFPSPTNRWHTKAQPCASPSRPELPAKGKSVLTTEGDITGIGGETACYFAAAGASRLALVGCREKPLADNKAFIEGKHPNVEILCPVRDPRRRRSRHKPLYRLWDTVAIANPNLRIFHNQPGVVLTELSPSVRGAASFEHNNRRCVPPCELQSMTYKLRGPIS